jgi:hypothetical protein
MSALAELVEVVGVAGGTEGLWRSGAVVFKIGFLPIEKYKMEESDFKSDRSNPLSRSARPTTSSQHQHTSFPASSHLFPIIISRETAETDNFSTILSIEGEYFIFVTFCV